MIFEDLIAKNEIFEFCEIRLAQLRNDRKKVLDQCEDEFKYELNARFSAKIEEIEYLKNVFKDRQSSDNPRNLQQTGKKIYINV